MVSNTPRPHFTPGKDPVPILLEAGWAPGSVRTGGNSLHRRDSIPDRPSRIIWYSILKTRPQLFLILTPYVRSFSNLSFIPKEAHNRNEKSIHTQNQQTYKRVCKKCNFNVGTFVECYCVNSLLIRGHEQDQNCHIQGFTRLHVSAIKSPSSGRPKYRENHDTNTLISHTQSYNVHITKYPKPQTSHTTRPW